MTNVRFQDAPNGRDEEAAEWCLRLAEDRLSPDEQWTLDTWLTDTANREALEEAIIVWQGVEAIADKPELIHLRTQALENFRRANSRRWTRSFTDRWRWPVGVAAALAFVFVVGIFLMRTPTQVYETDIGERKITVLADGSTLSLDAATKVKVRLTADRRQLWLLGGRAKFDVASDALRPFSVTAGNKTVVATGTSFSVELIREQMRVVLYEGRVRVLDNSDGSGDRKQLRGRGEGITADRTLVPGHELVASIAGTDVKVAPTDIARSLAWEAGQLSFSEEPLGLAVERINRYSDEKLVVEDATAAEFKISGLFTAGDTEAFVEGVSAVLPVTVIRQRGQVMFKNNLPCKKCNARAVRSEG